MALQLQRDLRTGDCLFTLGELGRVLNIPETRLEKAVAAGVVQPLGVVGRNVIVALSSRELGALIDAIRELSLVKATLPEVPAPQPHPEHSAPRPAVIPGTFTV